MSSDQTVTATVFSNGDTKSEVYDSWWETMKLKNLCRMMVWDLSRADSTLLGVYVSVAIKERQPDFFLVPWDASEGTAEWRFCRYFYNRNQPVYIHPKLLLLAYYLNGMFYKWKQPVIFLSFSRTAAAGVWKKLLITIQGLSVWQKSKCEKCPSRQPWSSTFVSSSWCQVRQLFFGWHEVQLWHKSGQ